MKIQIQTETGIEFEITQKVGLNFEIYNKRTHTRGQFTFGQLLEMIKDQSILDQKAVSEAHEERCRLDRLDRFYSSY